MLTPPKEIPQKVSHNSLSLSREMVAPKPPINLTQSREQMKPVEKKMRKQHFRNTSASLSTEDIEGSKPKTFRKIRKSYSSIGNDDIIGSKPNYAKKFEKRPSVVPSYVAEAVDNGASLVFFGPKVPEKKFVRDSLNTNDIEGAKSKVHLPDQEVRDLMNIDDIPGVRPSVLHMIKEKKNKN